MIFKTIPEFQIGSPVKTFLCDQNDGFVMARIGAQ